MFFTLCQNYSKTRHSKKWTCGNMTILYVSLKTTSFSPIQNIKRVDYYTSHNNITISMDKFVVSPHKMLSKNFVSLRPKEAWMTTFGKIRRNVEIATISKPLIHLVLKLALKDTETVLIILRFSPLVITWERSSIKPNTLSLVK